MIRTAPALLAACVLLACDITQSHIDQASERLAQATVAIGAAPTTVQITGPLQESHLAGSSWRLVDVANWPHAEAVVTLGTNGRVVWHVAHSRYADTTHWRVQAGAFEVGIGGSDWRSGGTGGFVDANNVCLEYAGDRCAWVLQRVTP